MRFAIVLGRLTTPLILAITFYLVVTPMGLLMRLLGGNQTHKNAFDSEVDSYRTVNQESKPENMERPY